MLFEMNEIRLSELRIGKQAVLAEFRVSRLHQRLLSMGFTQGTPVRVMHRLPWQGNLYGLMDGRNIALRHSEAEQILVNIT